jgi:hypothetical protein
VSVRVCGITVNGDTTFAADGISVCEIDPPERSARVSHSAAAAAAVGVAL